MTDFIRVKDDDTGHEFTIRETQFVEGAMTKLDKPALDAGGDPLPVKHKTSVAKAATAKKTASSGSEVESN